MCVCDACFVLVARSRVMIGRGKECGFAMGSLILLPSCAVLPSHSLILDLDLTVVLALTCGSRSHTHSLGVHVDQWKVRVCFWFTFRSCHIERHYILPWSRQQYGMSTCARFLLVAMQSLTRSYSHTQVHAHFFARTHTHSHTHTRIHTHTHTHTHTLSFSLCYATAVYALSTHSTSSPVLGLVQVSVLRVRCRMRC
jgi:hypothetical protein